MSTLNNPINLKIMNDYVKCSFFVLGHFGFFAYLACLFLVEMPQYQESSWDKYPRKLFFYGG